MSKWELFHDNLPLFDGPRIQVIMYFTAVGKTALLVKFETECSTRWYVAALKEAAHANEVVDIAVFDHPGHGASGRNRKINRIKCAISDSHDVDTGAR